MKRLFVLPLVISFAAVVLLACVGVWYYLSVGDNASAAQDAIVKRIGEDVADFNTVVNGKYFLAEELIDNVEDWLRNSSGTESLDDIVKMAYEYLKKDKDRFVAGYWANFESSYFSQRQIEEIADRGKIINRQFTTYSYRHLDDIIIDYNFDNNDIHDFYRVPVRTGKPFITDPFVWDGVEMLTISIPVTVDKETIGVGGVDLTIAGLQQMIEKIAHDRDVSVRLISNNYYILADSRKFENIAKSIQGDSFLVDVFRQLRQGKIVRSIIKNNEGKMNTYKIYYPVFVADSGFCWMLEVILDKKDLD